MSYSKISNYCTIEKTSLTGERQITLVPAALSDSYEDITILPVIDCFQNHAENIAVSTAIKLIVQSYTNPDKLTNHPWRCLLMFDILYCRGVHRRKHRQARHF